MILREFKLSKYFSLKLEGSKTIIYENGERFNPCKYILLSRKVSEIQCILSLESIDELENNLESNNNNLTEIPSEVDFWHIVLIYKYGEKLIIIHN